MNRNGEDGNTPIRSSRFFQSYDYWYYTTREGINIGPFDTLSEAESGVSAYIDFILHADQKTIDALTQYHSAA